MSFKICETKDEGMGDDPREKIQRGLDQLDRGEGIADDDLPRYLAKLKVQAEIPF